MTLPILSVFLAVKVTRKRPSLTLCLREVGVVAIGMQKLAAGSGYEYLTQQVAALDTTVSLPGES